MTALLAIGLILVGFGQSIGAIALVVGILMAVAWIVWCRPSRCSVTHRLLLGATAATGALGAAVLFGQTTPALARGLAISALLTGVLLLLAYTFRCCLTFMDRDDFHRPPPEEEQPELRSEREARQRREREEMLAQKARDRDALPNISGEADIIDEPHTHPPGPRRDPDHHDAGHGGH